MKKKTKSHSKRKHSTVGASTSERWLNCPGSVALNDKCEEEPESPASLRGTQAHEILEKLLIAARDKKKPGKLTHQDIELIKATAVKIMKLVPKGAKLNVEIDVDLSFIDPRAFGSLDISIVRIFDHLHIIDYKNGTSPVKAEKNTQLIFYALGEAHRHNYEFFDVTMTIMQPRSKNKIKESSWTISMEELKAYIPLFKKGMARTKDKKAKLFMGSWCFFCPAGKQGECPLMNKKKFGSEDLGFDAID